MISASGGKERVTGGNSGVAQPAASNNTNNNDQQGGRFRMTSFLQLLRGGLARFAAKRSTAPILLFREEVFSNRPHTRRHE